MDVTILFYKGLAEKTFHNIINIYSKDDMLCLRDDKDDILKIPLIHVKQISYKNIFSNIESDTKDGVDVTILFYNGSEQKIFNNAKFSSFTGSMFNSLPQLGQKFTPV